MTTMETGASSAYSTVGPIRESESIPNFDKKDDCDVKNAGRALRNCLGRFTTGVTIVTCGTPHGRHGLTVNAFCAVSLQPPLVLISIDRRAKACAVLAEAPFTVNVLSVEDQDVALHFAGRPQAGLSIEWVDGAVGPRLAVAVAYFSCRPWASYDGGDHVLYLGKVVEFDSNGRDPVLFHNGRFRQLGGPLVG